MITGYTMFPSLDLILNYIKYILILYIQFCIYLPTKEIFTYNYICVEIWCMHLVKNKSTKTLN